MLQDCFEESYFALVGRDCLQVVGLVFRVLFVQVANLVDCLLVAHAKVLYQLSHVIDLVL